MRTRFRGITRREAMLIDGPAGWGEFSPFVEYRPPEAVRWLHSGLEAAYVGLPAPVRSTVEINGTVPAVAPSEVAEVLDRFPGVRTFKVKVAEPGQSLSDDVARVAAVRSLRPDAHIRLDANMNYTVEQAVEVAKACGDIEYLEQPVPTVSELVELRRRLREENISTMVAADESIRKADDPLVVARRQAADVAVVKVAPLGGARRLLSLAEQLHGYGMSVTVSSELGTAVGINAGIAAVAALPSHYRINAAGLGTQRLFVEDVAAPRPLVDGAYSVAVSEPEPARLASLRADPQRRQWWIDRLRACWELLDGFPRAEPRG
ncbi:Mandelate racemase / muconate lactonizing enzyme, C-terminal domain [Corynebacterium uterequi]|uniref:Mandelate racemase / muconate lactonizing enzyme, C-terminal domain n=2 Tax=Corynebacterium uterequi TaxID=1072256 RepID=A0A0G3HAE5_9CORY|nr:Mandelate racemase / muconate lactonizing enzyme, C-terminal domain [Corynebacterium uterequi]